MTLSDGLHEGASRAGILLTDAQLALFSRFHALLTEKNRVMNLTRVPEDVREAADRNYLDSLSPLFHAPEGNIFPEEPFELFDLGAGAGFPGVPLSICLPRCRVTLLDAMKKRTEFLSEAARLLQLNARARQMRAEDAGRDEEFRERADFVTARAVAETNVLLEWTLPLLKVGGRLIAYKGPLVSEELARAENALDLLGGELEAVRPVRIPGRDWDHRLLIVKKTRPTPEKYPRKAAVIAKKPL